MIRLKLFRLGVICLLLGGFFISCNTSFHQKEIHNPIIPGFYPDPSVCKGSDGYYMVNSTFGYFPGIPVFYSPDLVHWKQIGHVLTRNSQLKVDGQAITTRGTYAPSIDYHNGTYYVTCTEVGNRGNYIVASKNPAGPWSELHLLPQVQGIDPSLFFDDDDRVYIVYNSDAPNNQPQYQGHRTIRINEIDINTLSVISDNRILVNGGVDITKKPEWIEGPHLFKEKGYYYLSAAEGGTGVNHSQVVFRSKSLHEPFTPWDKNPILTQRDLDPDRPKPITSTGHADFVQDLNGDWWAVFLGCRPYNGNHYNLGRETFMAPVEWFDGWPRINPNNKEVLQSYVFRAALKEPDQYKPLNGSFSVVDEFTSDSLSFDWVMIRNSNEKWYRIDTVNGGRLIMKVRPYSLIHTGNPSFLGRRQQHMKGHVTTSLDFQPQNDNDKAGLIIFQNVGHYYYLCKSKESNSPVVQLYKAKGDGMEMITSVSLGEGMGELKLKIESDVDVYRFYFSKDNKEWTPIGTEMDASFLSTQSEGGFTGCLYGLFSITDDEKKNLIASYSWFNYEGTEN